jgi:DNA-binding CsgD family transcriptional regulator
MTRRQLVGTGTSHEAALIARQQTIADLTSKALSVGDLDALLREAIAQAAAAVDADFVRMLQLLPNRRGLLLRAGVGWQPGVAGHATGGTGTAIHRQRPVVIDDLSTESWLRQRAHGIVSGVSVDIHGTHGALGALGVYTKKRRLFTNDDVMFLQALANVLGLVMDRWRLEQALKIEEHTSQTVLRAFAGMVFRLDWRGICLDFIPVQGLEPFVPPAQFIGKDVRDVAPLPVGMACYHAIRRALETGSAHSVRYEISQRGLVLQRDMRVVPFRQGQVLAIVRNVSPPRLEPEPVRVAVPGPYTLTVREVMVLRLVAGGKSDKEIAIALGISTLTSHKHVHNILLKMDAASRTEAGVRAVREGLIE